MHMGALLSPHEREFLRIVSKLAYCNPFLPERVALEREALGTEFVEGEPVWRLPLWPGYRRLLDSKTADLSSTGDSPHAGAITAALFLSEFVSPDTPWLHLDMMAWNPRARPGRPEGGEPQALRALYALPEPRLAAHYDVQQRSAA